jgi:hypothetical protein
MIESKTKNLDRLPTRRAFVTASTAAAAIGLISGCNSKTDETKPAEIPAAPQEPAIVALTREARDQMTPDSIIAKLKEGNTRFREGRKIPRDFLAEVMKIDYLIGDGRSSFNRQRDQVEIMRQIILKTTAWRISAPIC